VQNRHRRRPALWFAWWAVLMVVWLLLVDTTDPEELATGAVAAALAATLAAAVHQRGYIRFQPRLRWLRHTPALLWNVVVDCGLLGGALWQRVVLRRPVTGTTMRVPFEYGSDSGRDGARRALVNFAISLTPNSYVIDIDPEAHSLLIHQLVAGLPERIPGLSADAAS